VNKTFRIFSWIAVAALYSFWIGAYSAVPVLEQTTDSVPAESQGEYFRAKAPLALPGQVPQLDLSIHAGVQAPSCALKHTGNLFFICSEVAERHFAQTFLQYCFYAHFILIRLQATDLIFPFHYFW
jgi:hypothetical protein